MASVSPPSEPGANRALDVPVSGYVPADLTGDSLRAALEAAATWLELQAASINALNVYPVPDGDTGTNMSMTMRAAAEASAVEPSGEAHAVARAAARGALMGARGNSGVILSQLVRGFAEAVADQATLGVPQLANGLEAAARAGYRAVGKPVEGTILTVARRAGEEARAAAADGADMLQFWERVLRVTDRAVIETTDQLETLRRAGVVDAGAQGYRIILDAFCRTARGESIEGEEMPTSAPVASQALVAAQHVGEGGLGFCTEFLVSHAAEDEATIRAFMEALGDSVIVVGDDDLMRVHVHTLRPGQALDWAVERGTVSSIKIENMQLQHDAGKEDATGTRGLSKIGVVAVSPGAGFRALFSSMGAAAIVEGGQTMNPSVQDILTAISSVGYQELILLPNNSNILLAARQAAEQTPRSVRIVPTRSLPQGIAALLAFNYGEDLDTNVQLMEGAAEGVASIEVTVADRDSEANGQAIEKGRALGLLDDEIVAITDTLTEASLGALALAEPEGREIVTIYWGAGSSRDEAGELCEAIQDAHPHLETEIVEGGQPHYPYIISVE
ncbi:MAG TPA: DAK2 domain-containing protein [Chloroflexota bacterium]|nr:DAK2 domain-containing protein [Chloroflexota bacterium]